MRAEGNWKLFSQSETRIFLIKPTFFSLGEEPDTSTQITLNQYQSELDICDNDDENGFETSGCDFGPSRNQPMNQNLHHESETDFYKTTGIEPSECFMPPSTNYESAQPAGSNIQNFFTPPNWKDKE